MKAIVYRSKKFNIYLKQNESECLFVIKDKQRTIKRDYARKYISIKFGEMEIFKRETSNEDLRWTFWGSIKNNFIKLFPCGREEET